VSLHLMQFSVTTNVIKFSVGIQGMQHQYCRIHVLNKKR